MKIIYIATVLLCTIGGWANSHEFAPSLLKITELSKVIEERSRYRALIKTPTRPDGLPMLVPKWPDSCEIIEENQTQVQGDTILNNFLLSCSFDDKSLSGKTIGINGLANTQTSAVVIANLRDGRRYQDVLSVGKTKFLVPYRMDITSVLTNYSMLGFSHILMGLDHLMFVFGLMLLIMGTKKLILTITAFTVGHSITLILMTLGLIPGSSALIEFAIALSIFVLALELARDSGGGKLWKYPWFLAGGFGLLHGLGFAGALLDIRLPQNSLFWSLLAFNVGIELGQLIFILLISVLSLFLAGSESNVRYFLRHISTYLLGGLSVMWCIERGMIWLV